MKTGERKVIARQTEMHRTGKTASSKLANIALPLTASPKRIIVVLVTRARVEQGDVYLAWTSYCGWILSLVLVIVVYPSACTFM